MKLYAHFTKYQDDPTKENHVLTVSFDTSLTFDQIYGTLTRAYYAYLGPRSQEKPFHVVENAISVVRVTGSDQWPATNAITLMIYYPWMFHLFENFGVIYTPAEFGYQSDGEKIKNHEAMVMFWRQVHNGEYQKLR